MATRTYRPTAAGRRVLVTNPYQARRRRLTADWLTPGGEQGVISIHTLPYLAPLLGEKGISTTDTFRARLEALAAAAIEALDLLDGDPDAEPDFDGEEAHEGCCAAADDNPVSMPCRQQRNDFGAGTSEDAEADADEAWAQPVTLAPDRAPAKAIHFPRRPRTVQVTA